MTELPAIDRIRNRSDLDNKNILKQEFEAKFNNGQPIPDEDLTTVCAPGRVNLIGGHTDYCKGFVFPLAIGLKTYVLGQVNGTDTTVNVFSMNIDKQHNSLPLDISNLKTFDQDKDERWANYIIGVLACFHHKEILRGFDLGILSEVPLGGGLSSSASLEVGVYTFLEELFIDPAPSLVKKAEYCQRAENEYAKLPCGIMDQLICATAKVGHLTLIDCLNYSNSKFIAMPDQEVVFLITNSNVKHELTGTEYKDRRDATAFAAKVCEQDSLRHVKTEDLEKCREKGKLEEDILQLAGHVVNENQITVRAAESLKVGDYESVGTLMFQSHNSLSKNYNVSCEEQDKLVEIVKDLDGVYGSRMTGGGFGGCTVTLVEKRHVEQVMRTIHEEYFKFFEKTATFYITGPNEGARVLMF